MRPSEALENNRNLIRSTVTRYRGGNARVFGSVLSGNDTDASDLDILIDPTPEMTFFDIGAIRHELMTHLGVSVDVLTPQSLPTEIRTSIIREARPI